jgi:hypothetical protein
MRPCGCRSPRRLGGRRSPPPTSPLHAAAGDRLGGSGGLRLTWPPPSELGKGWGSSPPPPRSLFPPPPSPVLQTWLLFDAHSRPSKPNQASLSPNLEPPEPDLAVPDRLRRAPLGRGAPLPSRRLACSWCTAATATAALAPGYLTAALPLHPACWVGGVGGLGCVLGAPPPP